MISAGVETIAERMAQKMRDGAPSVAAAAGGLGDAAKNALTGVDFSSAGRQAGDTFANGLLDSEASVAAAARRLVNVARTAAGNASRQALSGALHDGVE